MQLNKFTVEVMNMSRYRYRPVTSPLPSRYRYRVTVTQRRPPLPTVTDRSPFLLNFKYLFKTHYITIGNACNASNSKIR
jgi:hypothetical protein